MKYYCRYCYSYDMFKFWHKKERKEWGFCRSCHKTAPLYKFYIDYDSGFYDYIDDRVHELKNERSN